MVFPAYAGSDPLITIHLHVFCLMLPRFLLAKCFTAPEGTFWSLAVAGATNCCLLFLKLASYNPKRAPFKHDEPLHHMINKWWCEILRFFGDHPFFVGIHRNKFDSWQRDVLGCSLVQPLFSPSNVLEEDISKIQLIEITENQLNIRWQQLLGSWTWTCSKKVCSTQLQEGPKQNPIVAPKIGCFRK